MRISTLPATIMALFVVLVGSADATTISFETTPPVPHVGDAYNFTGGSRDGLNVNDDNGLDGPLNDNFTYVANDRPRQGQTFLTPPGQTAVIVKSIWIKMVGYTNNGSAPELGYNGTDADLSSGGVFSIRVGTTPFPGDPISNILFQNIPITGAEPNNPAATGRVTTTNGSGLWMKFTFNPRPFLTPNALNSFDITSTDSNNRLFEWLGTSTDTYAGGNAYNGDQLGLGSQTNEEVRNPLVGDRVFFVEMALLPEPLSASLAALPVLALATLGRRRRTAA